MGVEVEGSKVFGKDVVKILAEREPDTATVLIKAIFAVRSADKAIKKDTFDTWKQTKAAALAPLPGIRDPPVGSGSSLYHFANSVGVDRCLH